MKHIKYPPAMQWEVLPTCNHNCIHCYNYWRTDKQLAPDTCDPQYMEIAVRIVRQKPAFCVITGGEPLLVFSKLTDPIKLLITNGIYVSLNTNATLVTDEIADFLCENNVGVLVSLPCSDPAICDQITGIDGSFDRIIKGIKCLIAKKIRLTVNMVVMQSNKDKVISTAEFLSSMRVDSFFASRVGKPANSSSEFDKELLAAAEVTKMQWDLINVRSQFHINIGSAGPFPSCSFDSDILYQEFACEKKCTAGKISYAVDFSGNVKACPRDDRAFGNILSDEFSRIWESMEQWRDDSLLPEQCSKCAIKKHCSGGCRLDSYPLAGCRNQYDSLFDQSKLPVKYKKLRPQQILDVVDEYPDYQVLSPKVIRIKRDEMLLVNRRMIFVQEDFGWRASVGSRFMYITNGLKNYLENRQYVAQKDLSVDFEVSDEVASSLIEMLLDSNLLYQKGGD